MIDPELVIQIRGHYFADHWKIGTIAGQLNIHPDTVRRAIGSERFNMRQVSRRASVMDPFVEYIEGVLRDYPRLRATRVFEMVRQRGYQGSLVQLRRAVRQLRPGPAQEPMLRLRTLPGEQGQVDWAYFGKVAIGRTERRLCCFAMTLSYSRALYFEFFLDDSLESFLRGHVRAFTFFGGSPREMLHDNLGSAVLARRGRLAQLHPRYLELAGHYYFVPRPCRIGRGSDKGRVERAIDYIRYSFFEARRFISLEQFNAEAFAWRDQTAHARPWPQDSQRTVAAVFAEELGSLSKLPVHPFETDLVTPIRSGKTIYIRFDGNDYSIPPHAVGRELTAVVSDTEVRIVDGTDPIAHHRRSWDRGALIEDLAHKEALREARRHQAREAGQTVLSRAVPESEAFLDAAFRKGEPQARSVRELESLLRLWGAQPLRAALSEALARGTPTLASVHVLLEKARRAKGRPLPAPPLDLSQRPELEAIHVQPHSLEDYDDLTDD